MFLILLFLASSMIVSNLIDIVITAIINRKS